MNKLPQLNNADFHHFVTCFTNKYLDIDIDLILFFLFHTDSKFSAHDRLDERIKELITVYPHQSEKVKLILTDLSDFLIQQKLISRTECKKEIDDLICVL
jgi:hypothetical protein